MDYEVFLLSRIRGAWLGGTQNSAAVARGVSVTARVISAAAAIMVVVFLGFVATPDVAVKQIGLGLAVAVLIDASPIRCASAATCRASPHIHGHFKDGLNGYSNRRCGAYRSPLA